LVTILVGNHQEAAAGGMDNLASQVQQVRPKRKQRRRFEDDPKAPVYAATFSPDGSHVLSGHGGNTMVLRNATTGEKRREFSGPRIVAGVYQRVFAVAFSPDGTKVLSGSTDKYARLWDTQSGALLKELPCSDQVLAVAFSPRFPKEPEVLTGNKDGTMQLWNTETGKEVRRFEVSLSGPVNAVAFSSNGAKILSGSVDKEVKLWDAETGNPLRTFSGHSGSVTGVAFSPDDTMALSGSRDKTIRLWWLDDTSGTLTEQWMYQECRDEMIRLWWLDDELLHRVISLHLPVGEEKEQTNIGSFAGQTNQKLRTQQD
jgi:WD40 repeat protein